MNKLLGTLIFPLALSTMLTATPAPQIGEVRIVGPSQSYLGVLLQDVTANDVDRLQLPRAEGVYVEEVSADSPAARAGLKAGDVIYEYSGFPVISVAQFRRLVSETPVDRKVELKVWRDGTSTTVNATIEARKSRPYGRGSGNTFSFRVPEVNPDLGHPGNRGIFIHRRGPILGIQGIRLTDQMADFLNISGKQGVLVLEVRADSPASKAGLEAGDVILSVDGTAVESPEDLTDALSKGKVELEIARRGQTMRLEADLGSEEESDAFRL